MISFITILYLGLWLWLLEEEKLQRPLEMLKDKARRVATVQVTSLHFLHCLL